MNVANVVCLQAGTGSDVRNYGHPLAGLLRTVYRDANVYRLRLLFREQLYSFTYLLTYCIQCYSVVRSRLRCSFRPASFGNGKRKRRRRRRRRHVQGRLDDRSRRGAERLSGQPDAGSWSVPGGGLSSGRRSRQSAVPVAVTGNPIR